MSDLGIRASFGAHVAFVGEPRSIQQQDERPPSSTPSSPPQDRAQQDLPSASEESPPSLWSEGEVELQCRIDRLYTPLKDALNQKLHQALTTELTSTLTQEMFQKICEGLHPRPQLPNRLEELTSSLHKKAIENVLHKHLLTWLYDPLQKRVEKFLPDLLNDLLSSLLSQDQKMTQYEEILQSMLKESDQARQFVDLLTQTQGTVTDPHNLHGEQEALLHENACTRLPFFQQSPLEKEYNKGLLQVLLKDFLSLVENKKDPILWNRRKLFMKLLALLVETFPGGLPEILQEETPPELSQAPLRDPSHPKKDTRKPNQFQKDSRQQSFDKLRYRMLPDMEPKEFSERVQNRLRNFLQGWLQIPPETLHWTVKEHLQTQDSLFSLVWGFQSAIDQPADLLQVWQQHFPTDHPRYHYRLPISLRDDCQLRLFSDAPAYTFACFHWFDSLKSALCQRVLQTLSTEQIQILHQKMFQKICEELHPRLPLPDRLKGLTSPPHREVIEKALQKHLQIWIKDLVEEQHRYLLQFLLHNLLSKEFPQALTAQNLTKYEDVLKFIFGELCADEQFIERFKTLPRGNEQGEIVKLDLHTKSLITSWFRCRQREEQFLDSPQILIDDLSFLMLHDLSIIQMNGLKLQTVLFKLLPEMFPGGLQEILHEEMPPKVSQDSLRPSYATYFYSPERKGESLDTFQRNEYQKLLDIFRRRTLLEKPSETFLAQIQSQLRNSFQEWLQSLSQGLDATIQRHLQTPGSFLPLVLDFQSVMAQNPSGLQDGTQPGLCPGALTTHSAAPSPPASHSGLFSGPCQVQSQNPPPGQRQYDWVDLVDWRSQVDKNCTVILSTYHDWFKSLERFLYQELLLHLSEKQTRQTLYQEMFESVRETLDSCVHRNKFPLAKKLVKMKQPPLREAIETGLQNCLQDWMKDLITERIENITRDLLQGLLQDKCRQKISDNDQTFFPGYRKRFRAILEELDPTFEKLKQVEKGLSLTKNAESLVRQHLLKKFAAKDDSWFHDLNKDQHEKFFYYLYNNLPNTIVLNMVPEKVLPGELFGPPEKTLSMLLPKIFLEAFQEELPLELRQDPLLGFLQYLFPGSDQDDERKIHLKHSYDILLYHLLTGTGMFVKFAKVSEDQKPFTDWLKSHCQNVCRELCNSLEENLLPMVKSHLEKQKSCLALIRHLQLAMPSDLLRKELHLKPTHEAAANSGQVPAKEQYPPSAPACETATPESEADLEAPSAIFPPRPTRREAASLGRMPAEEQYPPSAPACETATPESKADLEAPSAIFPPRPTRREAASLGRMPAEEQYPPSAPACETLSEEPEAEPSTTATHATCTQTQGQKEEATRAHTGERSNPGASRRSSKRHRRKKR